MRHERAWWTDEIVGELTTRAVLKRPEGNVGHVTDDLFHVEFARRPAHCPGCSQAMPRDGLVSGAARGTFECACGYTCTCRDAEASLVEVFPYSRWLLGEAPADTGAPPGTKPVTMACMSCGAGLKVDGTLRTVDCTYCDMSNYLPDGLWLRLHPKPKMEWFLLVIEIDEAALAGELRRKGRYGGS